MKTEKPVASVSWEDAIKGAAIPEDLAIEMARVNLLNKIPRDLYSDGLFTPLPVQDES